MTALLEYLDLTALSEYIDLSISYAGVPRIVTTNKSLCFFQWMLYHLWYVVKRLLMHIIRLVLLGSYNSCV